MQVVDHLLAQRIGHLRRILTPLDRHHDRLGDRHRRILRRSRQKAVALRHPKAHAGGCLPEHRHRLVAVGKRRHQGDAAVGDLADVGAREERGHRRIGVRIGPVRQQWQQRHGHQRAAGQQPTPLRADRAPHLNLTGRLGDRIGGQPSAARVTRHPHGSADTVEAVRLTRKNARLLANECNTLKERATAHAAA